MITNLPREQLIETGARLRAGHLLQQAGYTLALAKQEGAALEALLPQGFLAELEAKRGEVEQGLRERVNAGAEAKDSTRVQNETLRRVREWRRKLVALGNVATRAGQSVPSALTSIGQSGRSVPRALASMQQALALLKESAPALSAFPLYDIVLGEGESLAASLGSVDAAQEQRRLSDLPLAVQNFYFAKGVLYTGLKIVNDIGRALLAGEAFSAARFNLGLLYRRAGTAAVTPPAPPRASNYLRAG
jgi:hypothetical protein